MNPLDPNAPFFWTLSQNGNFTCSWSFLNSTVFASDGGFKHVIGAHDAAPGDAVFSSVFSSESAAATDAESKMTELLQAVLSRRPIRPVWEEDEDGGAITGVGHITAQVAPQGFTYRFMVADMNNRKVIAFGEKLATIEDAKAEAEKVISANITN